MPVCILCSSESFDEFDGLYFCDKCGTQSQEIRNEVDVEEDGEGTNFGVIQRRLKKATKRSRSKLSMADFGKPWLTFEAFQCLLKAQVDALIKLGVNAAIKDVVQQIWFRFLKYKGVAFTGAKEGSVIPFHKMKSKRDCQPGTPDCPIPGKDPKYGVEKDNLDDKKMFDDESEEYEEEEDLSDFMEEDDGNSTDGSKSSSDNMDSESSSSSESKEEHIGSVRYKLGNPKGFARFQRKSLTVVIIYLGLLYCNEPITIADLLRLISQGNVPFYKISDVLPGHMKFSKEDTSCFLMTELRLPVIHSDAVAFINFLDLPPIPTPNLHLIIAKLIIDLQLPAAIHRLAVTLLEASNFQPRIYFRKHRQLTCNELYEEMSMAFIIVAFKLIYGLDGCKEREGIINNSSYLDVPTDTLECWGCIALRLHKNRQEFIRSNFVRKDEDLKLFEKDCREYALFCSEEIYKCAGDSQRSRVQRHHSQFKACQEAVKKKYVDIMSCAVEDLEHGPMKSSSGKPKPTSFVLRRLDNGDLENVFCHCKAKQRVEARDERHKVAVADIKSVFRSSKKDELEGRFEKEDSKTSGSYIIYFDDLSGLNVHDSYRFLLSICAERILLTINEMHEHVCQVESMLFVLDD
eukprot:gene3597-4104_t